MGSPETSGLFDANNAANSKTGSFGINNGPSTDGMPMSGAGPTQCAIAARLAADPIEDSNDFIIIPSGVNNGPTVANENVVPGGALNTANVAAGAIGEDIFCGRFLSIDANNAGGAMQDGSVCSRVTPFRLGVRFDDQEATGKTGGTVAQAGMESKQEASGTAAAVTNPLGTSGFSLGFRQFAC